MIYNLIRRHEGLRLHAYRCEGGVWTVGYGHTADVNAGTTVTEDEAMRLLREDVAEVRGRIEHMCAQDGVTLSAVQADALTSFAFNVGTEALRRSTLWSLVKRDSGDPAIAREFSRWVYGGGRRLPGLVKRRDEEAALYFS